MQADTSYNDFVGTAAADISDHTSLKAFLIKRGVDVKRFEPIGIQFYHGYSHFFTASIICIDNDKSKGDDKHLVTISFEADFTHEQFFDLFKRFKVVITKKYKSYEDMDIKEDVMIDDRNVRCIKIDEETIRDEEADF